jgi:hypothetical protein
MNVAKDNRMMLSGWSVRLTLFLFAALTFMSKGLQAQQPPTSPAFYKTQNSDAWVNHTFHIQKKYLRVLVVDATDNPPRRIRASSLMVRT